MKWFVVLLIVVLLGQLVLFIYGRQVRKKMKNSVIEKYNLKTPKDAWQALADPEIPDADKVEIKRLYEGHEE